MRWLAALGAAVVVGLLVALPWYTNPFVESLGVTACVMALLTISWNLMGGTGGLFSFGHAGFFGVGAYGTAYLELHTGLPFVLTVVGGGVAAAVVGLLIIPCFRARGIYFAILTLALAEGLRLSAERFFPGGATGLFLEPVFGLDSHSGYLFMLVLVALALALTALIRTSALGLSLSAIRNDETAAEGVGVNTLAVKATVSVISAAMAGVAGGGYTVTQAFIDPSSAFDVQYSIVPVLMATLGGMGTLFGPVVGAVLWSAIDEGFRTVSSTGALSLIVYGTVLVLLATWLPAGVAGEVRKLRARWFPELIPQRPAVAGAASESREGAT